MTNETIKYHDVPFQFKRDISPKQKAIVEKHLEFSEALATHDEFKVAGTQVIDKEKARKLAEGLEFNETSLNSIEHQFGDSDSNDPGTPFVGNWTTGTLNLLIQEVGSSMEKDTLLSLEFPDKAVPEYKVVLDRMAPNSGILPEFDGDSASLPMVRPLDTYGLEYQPGLWAGRTTIGSKDIMFQRQRGGVDFATRGFGQMVAYNSVNLTVMALTRKKKLLSDAIFNNGFTYAGQTINSNIPGGNYVAMESMGVLNGDGSVTYATTDPLYTPFIAMTNIVNNPIFLKYRPYIVGIILNPADMQAIMNQPNVKPVSNILSAGATSLGNKKLSVQIGEQKRELMGYYAPGFEIPLLAEDEVWLGQNADGTANESSQNFFIPRGSMKILLDLTAVGGLSGAFHLTYNEVDPNVESPAMGLFLGVFPRNLYNSDNVNRLDIVAALAGAPAVYMPEAQFILTSLYSNV